MAEALLIEALPNGGTKEIQEMDFDEVPRHGDVIQISLGSVTARFLVEVVIHKVALGRKNKIVIRVRSIGGQEAQPQRPQLQRYDQPQALPPAVIDVTPEPPEEEWFFK